MTVVYNQTILNNRMTQVLNQISTGAMQILDASGNVLVSFANTGLAVSSGVLSFGSVSATVARTGQAASGQVTGLGSMPITGLTVGTGAGFDIILSSVSLTAGQTATLASGSITGR